MTNKHSIKIDHEIWEQFAPNPTANIKSVLIKHLIGDNPSPSDNKTIALLEDMVTMLKAENQQLKQKLQGAIELITQVNHSHRLSPTLPDDRLDYNTEAPSKHLSPTLPDDSLDLHKEAISVTLPEGLTYDEKYGCYRNQDGQTCNEYGEYLPEYLLNSTDFGF